MGNMKARFDALANQYEADGNRAHLEEMFHLTDTDHDGFVVKGELISMMEMGEKADLAANFVMSMVDKDNDHRLSLCEFTEFLAQTCEEDMKKRKARMDELGALYKKNRDRAHLVEIFHILDTDHDGVIKKSELVASMRSDMPAELANEIADFIIKTADKDDDHLLSIDEFVDFTAQNFTPS